MVAEAGALIPQRHQRMLLSLLDLEKATVEDIMVPRNEVVGIDLTDPPDRIRAQMIASQHTRLPLWGHACRIQTRRQTKRCRGVANLDGHDDLVESHVGRTELGLIVVSIFVEPFRERPRQPEFLVRALSVVGAGSKNGELKPKSTGH